MYYSYILYSKSLDKYYVGHTQNLNERLNRHNRSGSKYTSRGQPWEIAYHETFDSKELAYERERQIKGWKSKKMIIKLISQAG
ncbi:MAG: GIY-YIG nuclease family protein [Crocinitomicaceae bacterium]